MKHALLNSVRMISRNNKNKLDQLKCPKCNDKFTTKQILLDHMITQKHCDKKTPL